MTYQEKIISFDNDNYNPEGLKVFLNNQNRKPVLRFITCGSVDDGKSTLIGRLLYDTKLISEDQLLSLQKDSKIHGTQKNDIDFALLVDGLSAEREQGITIDVAYRYFTTDKRKFIVADTPGHEEYTRNMATGASSADLAIILIDARKGVLTQTERHSFITKLLGINHVVIAINKMDLVHYSEEVFYQIKQDYILFAKKLGIENLSFIPISALKGDNIATKSKTIKWYSGPSLIEHLEKVDVSTDIENEAFRLPVQWVNRPNADFRGFSGTVSSGTINIGDEVVILPAGKRNVVKNIIVGDRKQHQAFSDQAITISLRDEIDISRGDIIAKACEPAEITDHFQAHIIWMNEKPLLTGRNYLFKTCNKTVSGTITKINSKINVSNLQHSEADVLNLNEVSVVNISLHELIAFDRYGKNRTTGSFIIIDSLTNETVGCGMIDFGLRRSSNIHMHDLAIGKETHALQKNQKPAVLWFTGLSGSGKSTIANLLEKKLYAMGKHSYLLDGDNIRLGLNKDLSFTDKDRVENIRRTSEVSKLMTDAGLIVITSFISPFANERQMVKELLGDEFIEIFIDASIEVCENRDPKGLYKKARRGEIQNFTGIDSIYEAPNDPHIHIRGDQETPESAATIIIKYLEKNSLI